MGTQVQETFRTINIAEKNFSTPHVKKAKTNGSSQDAPPMTNGLRKCGIYTQWNFMQP
jgi:hypothetical protein